MRICCYLGSKEASKEISWYSGILFLSKLNEREEYSKRCLFPAQITMCDLQHHLSIPFSSRIEMDVHCFLILKNCHSPLNF